MNITPQIFFKLKNPIIIGFQRSYFLLDASKTQMVVMWKKHADNKFTMVITNLLCGYI